MTYTAQSVYQELRQAFREEGVESPDTNARILICHYCDISKEDLLAKGESEISTGKYAALQLAKSERLAGKPVSKILGQKEFYGRFFHVTEDTLDPRPETEILVECVLKQTEGDEAFTVLDAGTGTGCIPVTLLLERPNAFAVASDMSWEALLVAKRNAEIHGVADRIAFVRADWLDAFQAEFDYLISNPPYIPSKEIPLLGEEVRNHDPILALDGGNEGLNSYKKLLEKINFVLKRGGRAFFEIGKGQISDIERLVAGSPANLKRIIPDIAGIPRVVDISYGDK